jgi:two-component system, OmpR family, phosphate regulon sensor histidine kinase PhoR
MELLNDDKTAVLNTVSNNAENYLSNSFISQIILDKDLLVCKFSPSSTTQFNFTEDSVGKSICQIINNLCHASILCNIKWVLSNSRPLVKEVQTHDLRWYQLNIIPYNEKENDFTNGVLITFFEITARIKDLQSQQKLIMEYETLLDTIAHDIKNRLTSMLLSVQILKESDFERRDEVILDLQTLDNGIHKINDIIGELFESRNQQYKYEAVHELLNIENVLKDVKLALKNEVSATNASIKSEIECAEIVFPRRQLRSVLYNLISNSIKYRSIERSPEIFIKTYKLDDYIIISVRDNGIGIDKAKQGDVFSKFYRIQKNIKGTGIGLHLIKMLVTNAGGRIELESELGKGSEFKIYLKSQCKQISEIL